MHSSAPKSYKCEACGLSFDTNGKRDYHQIVVHRKLDQPIICRIDDCNKEFNSQYFLKHHVYLYHSGRQFRCNHSGCDYVTINKYNLSKHLKIHSKRRPFVCGIDGCPMAYNVKAYLTCHLKTHSNERPFLCDTKRMRNEIQTKR